MFKYSRGTFANWVGVLADSTVISKLGANFCRPAGPQARLITPHLNDRFCDQSRGYCVKFGRKSPKNVLIFVLSKCYKI